MNVRNGMVLAASAAAIIGALVVSPTNALASTSLSTSGAATDVGALAAPRNCPPSYACVYPQAYYQGTPVLIHDNNRYIAGGALDHPGSAYNNGSHCVVFYRSIGRSGPPNPLNQGTGWGRIGSNLPQIRSNQWTTTRC